MSDGNISSSKGRLTRDLICEAALEAIDAGGLRSVSMRMLASSLGVKASSLYHHFASKDELMMAVAEFLYRRLGRPPEGEDWAEQVKGTFLQLHAFLQAHPNAAPLLLRDLARSPVAHSRADALVGMVRRAGIDPLSSRNLISNLVALLVGHSLLSAWMSEEVPTEDEMSAQSGDGGAEGDLWIHRVFPPSSSDTTGADTTKSDREHTDLASRASTPVDAVFLRGLDALITGFLWDPETMQASTERPPIRQIDPGSEDLLRLLTDPTPN